MLFLLISELYILPDRLLFAMIEKKIQVRIWDVASGELLMSRPHLAEVVRIAPFGDSFFYTCGRQVFFQFRNGSAQVFETESYINSMVAMHQFLVIGTKSLGEKNIYILATGVITFSGSSNGMVYVYDAAENRELWRTETGRSYLIQAIPFDDRILILCGHVQILCLQ